MLSTGLLTVHLIGLGLGLGGATIGDISVVSALRRGKAVPPDLMRFVGICIWAGLAILTVSGVALFLLHPSMYLHLSGFIAKMVIVAVLIGNGWILHRGRSDWHLDRRLLLLGAISTVSWYASLLVAMFKTEIHLPLFGYLGLYVATVLLIWILGLLLFRPWIRAGNDGTVG